MEDNSQMSQGRKSGRVSQPFESTRVNRAPVTSDDPSSIAESPEVDETQDIKPFVEPPSSLMNDSQMSDVSVMEAKGGEKFKEEFNGLNNRLLSLVDRTKRHEANLAEAANVKRGLEKQIEHLRSAHEEQVDLLRKELDERVRTAVIAEERQTQLQKDLAKHEQAVKNRDETLEAQRRQQEELERSMVRQKQSTAQEARKAAEFKEAFMKAHEERESLKDECTRLKVDNAKLQERVKVASLERTMQESKVAAVEKELLYSSKDVSNKLMEQRKRIEALGLEKLEELRRKHSLELERCREQLDKRFQDNLKSYVPAEHYAALQTEAAKNLERVKQAETVIELRDNQIRELKNSMEELESSHRKHLLEEKRRRERVNKRLLGQSSDLEEIRKELEVYRTLLEGLDVEGNTFYRTPLGTKRVRTSLEFESPSCHLGSRILSPAKASTPNRNSANGTPVTLEARKALLKKALTPRKRTSSDGDEKVPASSSERDCKVM